MMSTGRIEGNRRFIWSVALSAALLSLASAASADWMEPEAGWDVVYSAQAGLMPDSSSATQQWTRTNYGSETSLISDGGVAALRMDRAAHSNPRWSSNASWAQGQANDKMTVDFRMRLVGSDDANPSKDTSFVDNNYQFLLIISRPATASQTAAGMTYQQVQVRLAQDKAWIGIPTSFVEVPVSLGTSYNDIRMHIDWEAGTFAMFLNGQGSAAATGAISGRTGTADNSLNWGHGTSTARGAVNIADFKITNSELATVPEPATMAVLGAGAAMVLARRRSLR